MNNKRLVEAPSSSIISATLQELSINSLDQIFYTSTNPGGGSGSVTWNMNLGCIFQGCMKIFRNNTSSQTLFLVLKTGITIDGIVGDDVKSFKIDAGKALVIFSTEVENQFMSIGAPQAVSIRASATPGTKATMNSAYPNAKIGFVVISDASGNTYIKKDDSPTGNWSAFPSVQLT